MSTRAGGPPAEAGVAPAQKAAADATRRRFLFLTGTTSAVAGVLGFLGATGRYLFPNVLYEPPSRFSVGRPEDFPPGTVAFLPNRRVFVFNSASGFYVISSVCTHLGCNVRHIAGQGFTCPCHGSRFDVNGQVTSGPAPRPLPWFGMSLSPREELVVDERRIVEPDFRFKA